MLAMPIYAYRCDACGHAKDVLQKMSDPLLTVCPACGAAAFSKQVTAAGFQLKGSGWYVTDFRDGGGGKGAEPAAAAKGDAAAPAAAKNDGTAASAAATAAAPPAAVSTTPSTTAGGGSSGTTSSPTAGS
jgi:putative FmdB family regulatory protein